MGYKIQVEGLDELRRDLRRVDDQLGKEMGKINKHVGEEVVQWAEGSKSKLAGQFPSYRSDILKVKASANQRRAQVTVRPAAAEYGTLRHPVFGTWMDQVNFARKVWPLPDKEGRLVGPVVDQHSDHISSEYLDAVTKLAREAIGD